MPLLALPLSDPRHAQTLGRVPPPSRGTFVGCAEAPDDAGNHARATLALLARGHARGQRSRRGCAGLRRTAQHSKARGNSPVPGSGTWSRACPPCGRASRPRVLSYYADPGPDRWMVYRWRQQKYAEDGDLGTAHLVVPASRQAGMGTRVGSRNWRYKS